MTKPVTHVLFDMDGLILDTEQIYTKIFETITSKYNKVFTFELKCKLMGMQSFEYATTVVNDLDLPISPEDFLEQAGELSEILFPQSKLMPGIEKLINHLHQHGIPIGLATSSSIQSYEMKTKNHKDFFALFPYKTWGSSDPEVKLGKPHPDIFLVAAKKFPDTPDPESCLVFEDSINGVQAAISAGMQVVMVPDPRFDRKIAKEAATLVLDTLEDFHPEIFGLPPY